VAYKGIICKQILCVVRKYSFALKPSRCCYIRLVCDFNQQIDVTHFLVSTECVFCNGPTKSCVDLTELRLRSVY